MWETEDDIRRHEARQGFGESFIALARSVYVQNDERSRIKKKINELLGSRIVEEKCYAALNGQAESGQADEVQATH